MQRPFVSFVIPTFNRRDDLRTTILSLAQLDYPKDRYEVFVVDNSSTDGTQAMIAELSPSLACRLRSVVKAPEGPGPARNLGALQAPGDFVVFIDSDVHLDPHWLQATTKVMQNDDRVGLVGGKLLYATRPELANAYGGVTSLIGLGWDGHEGEPHAPLDKPEDVLWINSSALLARRSMIEQIGGFDETFFYGYEESDLGWRANVCGWRAVVVPDALAYHRVAESVGLSDSKIVFHYSKKRLRAMLKNYGPGRLARRLPGYFAYALLDAVVRAPRAAKWQALAWNLRCLPETLRLRAKVQANRKTTDAQIDRLICPRWFPPKPLHGRRRRPLPGAADSVVAARDDRLA
jgi:GT2 family glycosyltransferase